MTGARAIYGANGSISFPLFSKMERIVTLPRLTNPSPKANEGIILRGQDNPLPILLDPSSIHLKTKMMIVTIPPETKLKK